MKLNLGCGTQAPPGWTNVDYAPGARLAKLPFFRRLNRRLGIVRSNWNSDIVVHDLRRTFPWADSSVDAIYSSHTLEHLSRVEGRRFLSECHRVLTPGGIIRVVVPDLGRFVADYASGKRPADRFIDDLGTLYRSDRRLFLRLLAPLIEFPHRCMYDQPSLLSVMDEAGFSVAPRKPFESELAHIRVIELPERTTTAVIVEGTKNRGDASRAPE